MEDDSAIPLSILKNQYHPLAATLKAGCNLTTPAVASTRDPQHSFATKQQEDKASRRKLAEDLLSQDEIIDRYERGWNYKGVLADITSQEKQYIAHLAKAKGSWLQVNI